MKKTKTFDQAIKRDMRKFLKDVCFRLQKKPDLEVTICDFKLASINRECYCVTDRYLNDQKGSQIPKGWTI